MGGTCTPADDVKAERRPTEADVASGRLFRYIQMDVSPSRVAIKSSGTFKAEYSKFRDGNVTLLNISNRVLGEPMHQASSLGYWSGYIYDYAENYEEMRRTALQFVLDRKQIQAEQLRNYALKLEELPIEYEEV